MINTALVSIIIPAYGTKGYIDKCLSSILNQTYDNFEVIVIDDGSPDDLYKIVEKYGESDARIQLIRQKNKGASEARNRGLNKAIGDYTFFVDSDDWIEPDAVELFVSKATDTNADVVMPDRFTKVYEDGKRNEEMLYVDSTKTDNVADFVVNTIIGRGRAWRVSSVLYRTSIIKKHEIKFPKGHTAEDMMFNLEFLSKANKISFISYPTLNVNKRNDSVTATYQSNLLETFLLIDKKSKGYIEEVGYDKVHGNIAVDSLLCRNIILLIGSEMSNKNKIKFRVKLENIYSILKIERVRVAFKQKHFIKPYWNSNIKIYYVILMRSLIKHKFKSIAILLAMLSNMF